MTDIVTSTILYFINIFGYWQICAMSLSLFLLLYRALVPEYFSTWMRSAHFRDPKFLAAVIGGISFLIAYQVVINNFSFIQITFPTLSFPAQLEVWEGTIHLRSFLCYAALLFYLWYKWDALIPAVATTWFGISIIELTFIPQHLVQTLGFFGLNWYGPFIGSMLLFIVLWKKESAFKILSKNFVIFFAAGLFVQYFLLLFRPWGITMVIPQTVGIGNIPSSPSIFTGWNNAVVINTSIFPNPPIQTWIFEFLNHFMKVLMTIAFCFVTYRGVKEKT